MCDFCDNANCRLTKGQVLKRGAIIERSADTIMRAATDDTPQTYSFKGVPAYYSMSALIPEEDERSPHAYIRYWLDEDEGNDGYWQPYDIENPLSYQTEKEFLHKFNGDKQTEKELNSN